MARQPAILELAGGKSLRQRVWEAIRGLAGTGDGTFTRQNAAWLAKVEPAPAADYMKGLEAGAWIGVVKAYTPRSEATYQLLRDNGVEAPRVRRDGSEVLQGRGNEALWVAMISLDSFTSDFVAALAGVKSGTARRYLLALSWAGYLDVLEMGKGRGKGGTPSVYRVSVAHIHGPRAPMITRLKSVYDPNLHQIVWSEGADAAADAVEIGEVVV